MVNETPNLRRILWTALLCAAVLGLAAWSRGAEYDEQYTLFLTSGVARPDWPETVFPAGLVRVFQSGQTGLVAIGRDLRATDVHPPLYFWLVSIWRALVGPGLFAARLFSVTAGLGALALTGTAARLARLPVIPAVLLTLGCYGFTYTSVVARGFALAQLLLLGGVVCLLMERRTGRYALAGLLFGAATFTNYLALFVAAPCLCFVVLEARFRGAAVAAAFSFLVFVPGDLWWFMAQRGSRDGQFHPFSLIAALVRLAGCLAGSILGGLPLYAEGVMAALLSGALGLLLLACAVRVVRRGNEWPRAIRMFVAVAVCPVFGLFTLGAIFNNTPFEVRYLAFAMPFAGLLLAGSLGRFLLPVVLLVQTASIVGLMFAPQTMQPMRAAARDASSLVGDGIVLLPRGNDGVGIVGAFAGEARPALPLLLIRGDETPEQITARIGAYRRVVLALLARDDASRDASAAMSLALSGPGWREVARRPNLAVYERLGDGG